MPGSSFDTSTDSLCTLFISLLVYFDPFWDHDVSVIHHIIHTVLYWFGVNHRKLIIRNSRIHT